MKFRPDIEGLRAVAVLLVIFSHLQLSGNIALGGFIGVDIFFVISGYLITTLLMHEYSKNASTNWGLGWISLRSFYFRRARRIMPTAILVLIATVSFSYIFLNSVKAGQNLKDALFALLFLANVNLISQKTDYFQQGFSQGPLQHFWSLSVEEQFYFIFPTLFLLTVLIHGLKIGKYQLRWESRLAAAIGLLTASSLLWSIVQSSSSPVSGYFSSLTRAWEIGLGSLLAIATFKRNSNGSKPLKHFLEVMGVTGILISVLFFNSGSLFPGVNALLPTISTCCLIYVGTSSSQGMVTRVLSSKGFTYVGKISYSLYLWHLPILILVPRFSEPQLSQRISRVILLLPIFFVSSLTYYYIERPIRSLKPPVHWQKRRKVSSEADFKGLNRIKTILPLLIIGTLVVGVVYSKGKIDERKIQYQQIVDWTLSIPQTGNAPTPKSIVKDNNSYQQVLMLWQKQLSIGLNITKVPKDLIPPLSAQSGQSKGEWGECLKSLIPSCTSGSINATKTAVVVGDSYASAIFPMITTGLNQANWKVVGIFRGQCMIANVIPVINGKADNACWDFRKKWFSYLMSTKPDLIFLADNFDTAISMPKNNNALDYWQSKLGDSLKLIASTSKNVVYFTAPPGQKSLTDCVSAEGNIGPGCVGAPSERNTKRQTAEKVASAYGVRFIDGREWICVFAGCPAIVGNVSVFAAGHFSRQFAVTLAPLFKAWLSNNGIEN